MANERRLIDANEIEELFYKQVEYGATDLMDAFDDALQDCQTVDAVEVCRCADCKNNPRFPETSGENMVWCRKWICETKETDFCSYGEKREVE